MYILLDTACSNSVDSGAYLKIIFKKTFTSDAAKLVAYGALNIYIFYITLQNHSVYSDR
jgi:hypothetical protein